VTYYPKFLGSGTHLGDVIIFTSSYSHTARAEFMLCGRIYDTVLVNNAPVLTGVGETIAEARTHLPFVSVSFDDQEGQKTESYALSLDSYTNDDTAEHCAHG